MKGIVGFNIMGRRSTLQTQDLLYCKISLVSALLGVAFGHRNLQTLPRHTYFCGDLSKKGFIQITQEAWRN
jgi:hypothetical protein